MRFPLFALLLVALVATVFCSSAEAAGRRGCVGGSCGVFAPPSLAPSWTAVPAAELPPGAVPADEQPYPFAPEFTPAQPSTPHFQARRPIRRAAGAVGRFLFRRRR